MSFREVMLDRARYRHRIESLSLQQAEKALCRKDVAHWVNTWCWTYDPRLEQKNIPFILWPIQEKFLRWLQAIKAQKKRGLVEKGRDKGATYLVCADSVHDWLFVDAFAAGFGSRKYEYVDKLGDPKTIFYKIRDILYGLPKWMLPDGFDRSRHDNEAKLINPANGATITGEGGDEIGRGGRTSIYYVDEAARLTHPEMVDASLHRNTEVRVDISTPNGPGNPFARMRFSLPPEQVFTLHYRDDPRETRESIAARKATTDSVVWAQEEEIDYTASISGIAIPAKWVLAAVNLLHPAHATGPILAGFDVAEEGKDFCVVIIRRGPIVSESVHSWGGVNPTESAGRARRIAEEAKVEQLAYDALSVGAGITGPWQTAEIPLKFSATGVKASGTPTEDYWPDGTTSKDKFKNLRAEMWWKLRARFEKAWEHKEKGVEHPVSEMISIPNHPQLIAELSAPLAQHTETGKIQIESKVKMRARGIKSPDFADALALAFFATGDRWQFTSRIPKSLMESAPKGTWIDEGEDDMAARIERMGW